MAIVFVGMIVVGRGPAFDGKRRAVVRRIFFPTVVGHILFPAAASHMSFPVVARPLGVGSYCASQDVKHKASTALCFKHAGPSRIDAWIRAVTNQ